MAEGLVEAGGIVHCFDQMDKPDEHFEKSKQKSGGALEYHQVDVTKMDQVDETIAGIASRAQRLDGLIAAAGVTGGGLALEHDLAYLDTLLAVNVKGVFLAARACAHEMNRYKTPGAMCLVASMSGTISNRGFDAPIYNSSKAAVVQLARSLAAEWGRKNEDGTGGIRVNSLSPGYVITPMTLEDFRTGRLNKANMADTTILNRCSMPEEFKAAGLFLLSDASSFMTGSDLMIDGGTTAWR
ncbi:NAD(P)-binding protein [Pleomassaria siparia CBS 279.74]|uniref:NAD(P)-binding protein n=1 Tax=Pleomassaria siparia CBS 279.74 TaxID=1314801 RepID=A0A6G1K0V2_9PLEO|nr:NAD(P)-binding protein [Pleomassaria siparia CBS 279.74]